MFLSQATTLFFKIWQYWNIYFYKEKIGSLCFTLTSIRFMKYFCMVCEILLCDMQDFPSKYLLFSKYLEISIWVIKFLSYSKPPIPHNILIYNKRVRMSLPPTENPPSFLSVWQVIISMLWLRAACIYFSFYNLNHLVHLVPDAYSPI